MNCSVVPGGKSSTWTFKSSAYDTVYLFFLKKMRMIPHGVPCVSKNCFNCFNCFNLIVYLLVYFVYLVNCVCECVCKNMSHETQNAVHLYCYCREKKKSDQTTRCTLHLQCYCRAHFSSPRAQRPSTLPQILKCKKKKSSI
jgi:hypothetical protein